MKTRLDIIRERDRDRKRKEREEKKKKKEEERRIEEKKKEKEKKEKEKEKVNKIIEDKAYDDQLASKLGTFVFSESWVMDHLLILKKPPCGVLDLFVWSVTIPDRFYETSVEVMRIISQHWQWQYVNAWKNPHAVKNLFFKGFLRRVDEAISRGFLSGGGWMLSESGGEFDFLIPCGEKLGPFNFVKKRRRRKKKNKC